MANVFYSIAQEGRGHSSRAIEIIRRLTARGHSVTVATGGDSFEPLKESLHGNNLVKLLMIPGLKFKYDNRGRLNYLATFSINAGVVARSLATIKELEQHLKKGKFDLVISDFEPFLPRAARNLRVPFITIDNQHRFVFEKKDSSLLVGRHAISYYVTKGVIKAMHPLGKKCIITSCFTPKLSKERLAKDFEVIAAGPVIRSEVEGLRRNARKGSYSLVYVKKPLEAAIIPKILLARAKFVMYVGDPLKYKGFASKNVKFKKHSAEGFVKDLALCNAVISSAGEQLMSEALYLGKPLFLLPEEGTYEQKLNSELVKKHKVGDAVDISRLEPGQIESFLSRLPFFENNIRKLNISNDVDKIMQVLTRELS